MLVSPQTHNCSSVMNSESQSKNYLINIFDHDGLFEGHCSIECLASSISPSLNLIFFVLKYKHNFDVKEVERLEAIVSEWKVKQISALVLTHCEHLLADDRVEMIKQFIEDHPSITKLMGMGVVAVGFSDNSHIQPGTPLSQSVEEDKAMLRQLIYVCDEPVVLSLIHI